MGVEEIIIAFDRQYRDPGDQECKQWIEKLTHIHNKYHSLVQISFIFDNHYLLGYKDSPVDQGKEIFIELFKNRIQL